MVEKLDRVFT